MINLITFAIWLGAFSFFMAHPQLIALLVAAPWWVWLLLAIGTPVIGILNTAALVVVGGWWERRSGRYL